MNAVAIDWSGAKKPDSKIWIAEAVDGSLRRLKRLDSRDHALDELLRCLRTDERTVVGLDFAFSFPSWFCRTQSVSNAIEVWGVVREEGERWLRECSWPFWGRPGKRKPALEADFRRTEKQVGATYSIRPKSVFQIGGAGAVGTGSIRGMPFLSRIREEGFAVWPFDAPSDQMVVEIYPRVLTGEVVKNNEAAREKYLAQQRGGLSALCLAAAIKSEDAFDAAMSALAMDTHFEQFQGLPSGDALSKIEGEIWTPSGRATYIRRTGPDGTLTPECAAGQSWPLCSLSIRNPRFLHIALGNDLWGVTNNPVFLPFLNVEDHVKSPFWRGLESSHSSPLGSR